jgi:hypothetical protein
MRWIRRMFELRRSGMTYKKIAELLCIEGYRRRHGKGLLPRRRIETIIHTPMYWPTVNTPEPTPTASQEEETA